MKHTQAQIDAAIGLIERTVRISDGRYSVSDAKFQQSLRQVVNDAKIILPALTSAAEAESRPLTDQEKRHMQRGLNSASAADAGEPINNDLNAVLLGFTNYVMNERVRSYNEGIDTTIERCAQVCDDGTESGEFYAAKIRALKDKP